MIIEKLFDLIFGVVELILDILPDLPSFDETLLDDFRFVLDTIFDNAHLLGFFFPIDTIKLLIPLSLIVVNFNHVYRGALWVVSWIKSHN